MNTSSFFDLGVFQESSFPIEDFHCSIIRCVAQCAYLLKKRIAGVTIRGIIYLMSNEGPYTQQEQETVYEEVERDPEVAAAFARAEEGMEPIPEIVEVENVGELAQLLGVNPEALEQYRIINSAE